MSMHRAWWCALISIVARGQQGGQHLCQAAITLTTPTTMASLVVATSHTLCTSIQPCYCCTCCSCCCGCWCHTHCPYPIGVELGRRI